MATNIIPSTRGPLINLGTNMLAGLTSLGTSLSITQITPPDFQTILDSYVNSEDALGYTRSGRQAALTTWGSASVDITEWLGQVRLVLAGRFGIRWSTEWAQAGYVNGSCAVPKKMDDQLSLALSLVNFFTAYPSYQNSAMQVTAARGTTLRNAALAARQTVATLEIQQNDNTTARDAAQVALQSVMRSLVNILRATLSKEDPRWLAFGLNIPATRTTPDKPENLSVVLDETGSIILTCDEVSLATRYRWRMLIVNAQTSPDLVATTTRPYAVVKGLLPGTMVQFFVQAANGDRQGVPSDAVFYTVPTLKAVGFTNLTATEETPLASERSNGNGNGNGHSRTTRVS